MEEKFTFFWKHRFGQWSRCKFEVDGHTYNCCEQYMMAEKARLFNDEESLKKIMASTNPKEQKALGRKVKNFDYEKWNEEKTKIVYKGNYHRFNQNEEDLKLLFETDGTTLVEASPYDKIWGIGMKENDPRALDRDQWIGQNLLGETLTKVRRDLMTVHTEWM